MSLHQEDPHVWVIVLAAGEGRRLQSLTTDARGVAVPKQYCSFDRDEPKFEDSASPIELPSPSRLEGGGGEVPGVRS